MPLHRHECESCGHRFRILIAHGEQNDAPTCPECGSTVTRRMMPLVAVQFTGSGYYKTDHGRKGGVRPDKGGNGASDSGEAKSSDDSGGSSEKKTSSDATTGGDKRSGSSAPGKSKSSTDD